jgi:hypothetical protein
MFMTASRFTYNRRGKWPPQAADEQYPLGRRRTNSATTVLLQYWQYHQVIGAWGSNTQ